jgi:hypothetical protein
MRTDVNKLLTSRLEPASVAFGGRVDVVDREVVAFETEINGASSGIR